MAASAVTGETFEREVLARDLRVDLHGLPDLVQDGCPPELAARILAPVDGESRLT